MQNMDLESLYRPDNKTNIIESRLQNLESSLQTSAALSRKFMDFFQNQVELLECVHQLTQDLSEQGKRLNSIEDRVKKLEDGVSIGIESSNRRTTEMIGELRGEISKLKNRNDDKNKDGDSV